MNRNVESHFALNPVNLDIPRSQFDRSAGIKFSADIGKIIPFFIDEVLPGDTFKVTTSKVVRLQTLLHPIMDNMYLDTYYFFVPNRLVWDHWKHFCGEQVSAWSPNNMTEYRIPKINTSIVNPHPGEGSLMDYMGIPLNVQTSTDGGLAPKRGINALPFRAYAKICNDWFRSEVLTDELVIPTTDADVNANAKTDPDIYCAYGGPVFTACKYHDYFTSCLPAPQSGPAAVIPSNGVTLKEPIFANSITAFQGFTKDKNALTFNKINNTGSVFAITSSDGLSANSSLSSGTNIVPRNLIIDTEASQLVSGVVNQVNMGTINELRIAFQVQKFYEKLNRGRRYIEVLKSMFGVTSPDARLQRSEYLGGNRIPINVSEVTNNAKSDSAFVGDLGAMSRTVDSHEDFVHSFTEHGFVIGVCVVRYDHSYPQGIERFWTRTSKFDYYWPVFANIGEQAVMQKEINFLEDPDGDADNQVFGYAEAWADYRFKPNRVAGEMRPESTISLASWHLSDYYSQEWIVDPDTSEKTNPGPFLSDSWIREDKTNVDRTLAVTSEVANQYFADFYIKNICTRVMPVYSIPGLADHH